MTNLTSKMGRKDKVPWSTVVAYGAPAAGAGYMYLLLSLYVMKFATDVLQRS